MKPRVKHLSTKLDKDGCINVAVTVTIIVGMAYDEEPTEAQLRRDAAENFLDHPAIQDLQELIEGPWIDSITNVEEN